jgi:hypothetical protein
MPSRLLSSIVFAGVFAIGASPAQQGATEVLLPRPDNIYPGIVACGAGGQVYFRSISSKEHFVLRLSLDGSSLTFGLPDGTMANAVAPYPAGVNISSQRFKTKDGSHGCRCATNDVTKNEETQTNKPTGTQTPGAVDQGSPDATSKYWRVIYHFDDQGNLLAQHSVSTDLFGGMMATTSSGTTILVGRHQDKSQYGGVVLDAEDRVIKRFELPSPPEGGRWRIASFDRFLTAGDGVVYALLHSDEPQATMIATISETGNVNIKSVPEPMSDDPGQFNKWFVGPGGAVEMYRLASENYSARQSLTYHFDEYDLKSGEKIASKTSPLRADCYYGNTATELDLFQDKFRFRLAELQ